MARNLRAEKAVKNIMENPGSVSQAMRNAGYGEGYAKNPQEFVATKTFKALLDRYLPEDKIAEVHAKFLEKRETAAFEGEIIKGDQLHPDALKAVEMAYKLRGSFAPEKLEISDPVSRMSDEELDKELARLEKDQERDDG